MEQRVGWLSLRPWTRLAKRCYRHGRRIDLSICHQNVSALLLRMLRYECVPWIFALIRDGVVKTSELNPDGPLKPRNAFVWFPNSGVPQPRPTVRQRDPHPSSAVPPHPPPSLFRSSIISMSEISKPPKRHVGCCCCGACARPGRLSPV